MWNQHKLCFLEDIDSLVSFKIFFKFIYLFWERDRGSEQERGRERGAEREGERIRSRFCAFSMEPHVGLELTNYEVMTKSRMLNLLSHPGPPLVLFKRHISMFLIWTGKTCRQAFPLEKYKSLIQQMFLEHTLVCLYFFFPEAHILYHDLAHTNSDFGNYICIKKYLTSSCAVHSDVFYSFAFTECSSHLTTQILWPSFRKHC